MPIRVVARALGKSTETLRKWELQMIFPPAPFRSDGRRRKDRLYPLSYVERVVEIAKDEGVLCSKVADFRATQFPERVWALFFECGFNAPLPNGVVRD